VLGAALAILASANGCFLFPPPRSAYLPIHQHALNGDAAAVAQDLQTDPKQLEACDDARLTPLHLAAAHCHANVVTLLLDQGASPKRKDPNGSTPLHLAAQEGCLDAARALVEKGAKVNARDNQHHTPLWRAENWEQLALVTFLREHGGTD
jgi:ankyrin repeat protein